MRTVTMYIDTLHGLGKDVSSDVAAFFKDENAFAGFDCKMSKYRTKQAASYHEIIVMFHILPPKF